MDTSNWIILFETIVIIVTNVFVIVIFYKIMKLNPSKFKLLIKLNKNQKIKIKFKSNKCKSQNDN